MDTWSYSILGFDPARAALDGSRFLCANGYMGLRGAPEEAGRELYPAVTLAGVYDQYRDKWREPVNAPHALFARTSFNGKEYALGAEPHEAHRCGLDYRHGVYCRETDFGPVTVRSERFASLPLCHLLADRYQVTAHEDGEVVIRCGISTDIWDINGPHLFDFRLDEGEVLTARAVTGQKGILVAVSQYVQRDFDAEERQVQDETGVFRLLHCPVKKGQILTLDIFAAVYTSLDVLDPLERCAEVRHLTGYEALKTQHAAAWEGVWRRSEIQIEGDDEAARALHASQYHLNCVAPRHALSMSIPARGLSGQTYKGAIFWDSEIFFFPMFVHTQPGVARSLLRYRIETLPGALKKAAEYGYRGAFYAWESQEGGEEGCTNFNVVDVFTHRPVRTYFRDKQIHISADIVYALRQYYEITGDRTLLEEGGAEVILQCARFYLSRANAHLDTGDVDFADVIGPDEYHERVTNNAFTNRMIRHCVESALGLKQIFADDPGMMDGLMKKLDYEKDWALLSRMYGRIRAPQTRDSVIEQFDGYFRLEDCSLQTVRGRLCDPKEYWGGDHGVAGTTEIIKQADVIAMLALFPEDFSDADVRANWAYYEPRTEHGSSLSACMYALTACRIGRLEEAWQLFMKTASIDIVGGGKQWAGEIYIGGTHPASNGGAWMIAALGFAGLRMRSGVPEVHPRLPRQLKRLTFPVTAGEKRYVIDVRRTESGETEYSVTEMG